MDDCQTLIITVLETNSAPELEEIEYDDEVDEMVLMTFTAVATDSDPGDIITYSFGWCSSSAAIDPSTGVFTWTPSEAQGLEITLLLLRYAILLACATRKNSM
jgi:hypothetical protein